MIFPPYLGFGSGTEWIKGFTGYFVADIGLVIITLLALAKQNGQSELLSAAGSFLSGALLFIIVMCLGPVISIPRTAATTYELSIVPILGEQRFPWFYILFFITVMMMCFNKSKIVDFVGKILTPLLISGLLVLIIKGMITPVGAVTEPSRFRNATGEGIKVGYQTMDVLAAVVFGALLINSAADKGYGEKKRRFKIVLTSSLVAGLGLFVVYLGLTYLGATACGSYTMHISRTELLTDIIAELFPGKGGLIFFGVVAGLACVSTAVALTGSAAEYFEKLTNGRVQYRMWVAVICAFGALLSMVGVEKLVQLASPLLSLVYPPVLTSVLLSFAAEKLLKFKLAVKLPIYTAMLCGLYEAVASFGLRFIDILTAGSVGLTWLIPCIAMFVVGFIIDIILINAKSCRK